MGRNRSPKRAEERRNSAHQRLMAQSATTAQVATETEVPDITEATSRVRTTLQELPDHLCEVPEKCNHKGTPNDCFWTTYKVTYNRLEDVELAQAA